MCDHGDDLRISVIIPTLNEEAAIASLVAALRPECAEVIVADGGSSDETIVRARAAGATVVHAPRGRGQQMGRAAEAATGDVLWFLHADSVVTPGSGPAIARALATADAGVFRLEFAGASRAARVMTWTYSQLTKFGLIYGDAGLFVRRDTYRAAGGFAPIPLFEDQELIGRLRRQVPFVIADAKLITSARRFEGRFARTWLIWITLQALYWLGVPPSRLARWYARSAPPRHSPVRLRLPE